MKDAVIKEIDSRRDQLRELSLKIHGNPEIGFCEVKAAEWLSQYLEQNGFSVERGTGGLPTAFKARYGNGKPAIALLAEYDAFPGLGHACGHNLIAASAVGAGIASKLAVDKLGGSVIVFGTPAEEFCGDKSGGKIVLVEKGAFDDIDAAMLVHPGQYDSAVTYAFAARVLEIEFFGKAAHASARPEAGINALEAIIQSFNAINALRQHTREKARIHGIITHGGDASNIVPAYSAGSFAVRAADDAYLVELEGKVTNCFIGAATVTGARLEYRWGNHYATMRNNPTLVQLFTGNMESLGRKVKPPNPAEIEGSTDTGNVSHLVPALHAWIRIVPPEVGIHTPQFTEAAAGESGEKGFMDAARALAMTVVDLLASPATMSRAKEEFQQGS